MDINSLKFVVFAKFNLTKTIQETNYRAVENGLCPDANILVLHT